MQTIAFVTEQEAIEKILGAMKMATVPPEVAKAEYFPDQGESFSDYAD